MACVMPKELFEPQGVDAMYVSFLVNMHRSTYPGSSAILRLSHWTSGVTFRLVRLLKSLQPKALCVDGVVLWVESNLDGTYTRRLIPRDQYNHERDEFGFHIGY